MLLFRFVAVRSTAIVVAATLGASGLVAGLLSQPAPLVGLGRDPLVPPAALYAGQSIPPIEVTLIGVDSHRPDQPLAVVRVDSRPPVRRVVRPGDRIDVYRVLRIGPRSVRVSVPGLGGNTVLDIALRDSSSSSPTSP